MAGMTTEKHDELRDSRLAELAACCVAPDRGDDPPECVSCGTEFTVPDDLEVSAVCNLCAQEIVRDALPRLIAEVRHLRADVSRRDREADTEGLRAVRAEQGSR
jgi:predicted RNA-binding Zn-ribbon protein involved in translation (DUF1610 family)